MFSNSISAKDDLTGITLECSIYDSLYEYIEFLSGTNVTMWKYIPSRFVYFESNDFYKATPKHVQFYYDKNLGVNNKYPSELNRETLEYGSYKCKVIEPMNIKQFLIDKIVFLIFEYIRKCEGLLHFGKGICHFSDRTFDIFTAVTRTS